MHKFGLACELGVSACPAEFVHPTPKGLRAGHVGGFRSKQVGSTTDSSRHSGSLVRCKSPSRNSTNWGCREVSRRSTSARLAPWRPLPELKGRNGGARKPKRGTCATCVGSAASAPGHDEGETLNSGSERPGAAVDFGRAYHLKRIRDASRTSCRNNSTIPDGRRAAGVSLGGALPAKRRVCFERRPIVADCHDLLFRSPACVASPLRCRRTYHYHGPTVRCQPLHRRVPSHWAAVWGGFVDHFFANSATS